MVQVVHAAVPGRTRYEVEGLYHSQSLKRVIEERLADKQGIHSVSAEPLTGKYRGHSAQSLYLLRT